MYFEMQSLNSEQRSNILHSLVLPRPIAWISSVDGDGTVNVAPFSFFNAMSGDPPLLCVCIGSRQGVLKDTARNIAATGEFVVNLVSEPLARRMAVDRKSTRLSSSHLVISYAVFCLKKKTQ